MVNLIQRARNFMLGADIEDEDEEDYGREYAEEYEEEPAHVHPTYEYTPKSRNRGKTSNVISLQTSVQMQMEVVIMAPEDIDGATSVCDFLRDNKMCIINLEGVERSEAQRIADFLGGVGYALQSNIKRINNEIFMMSPHDVPINSDLKEDLKNSGFVFPWINAMR